MPYGYNGRILRVDLTSGRMGVEELEENLCRRYLGGRGLISYLLLRELRPGVEPLGPENKLIFAAGVLTGAPVSGSGRNSVGARSPLTGAYGDGEVGGYWGAELKRAGFDAIVVEGKATAPVYLWIKDGQAQLRDARHLWSHLTADVERALRQDLGDPGLRVAQIGPAGEAQVRFACVINDVNRAAGRTGMGAVMGSKNLKAIAVRGTQPLPIAQPQEMRRLALWLRDNVPTLARRMHDEGTPGGLFLLNRDGGLPTRNFRQGTFEGAGRINGRVLRDTYLVARRSCWACAVRCKREVALSEPYAVDPAYGGPEYETIAALGSNCGIDDLAAICKGNELCAAYGLDTISTGMAISFAMECFQAGLLTEKDAGGLRLDFGNAPAMVQLVEDIGRRQGLGRLLGEGVARAAQAIGRGAEEYALHIKGQEVPMHEPRYKQGMGLGYALSPTGADHCHNLHDSMYTNPGPPLEELKSLGVLEPLPLDDLSPAKVRMFAYIAHGRHALNCLVQCYFVPFNMEQIAQLVQYATGWNFSLWELMKVGERCATLTRAFNLREGFSREDDCLPRRFFTPLPDGPRSGVAVDPEKLEQAKLAYYRMMGWDEARGAPTLGALQELDLGWAAQYVVD